MEVRPTLGFLGLGRMGQAMALRLLDAGFRVNVWNREPERLPPAVERGAIACDDPAGVARGSSIVLSCLLDADAVEQVVFGPGGVADAPGEGRLFVDHASIPPAITRDFAARLLARNGMRWIDAPVSGSVVGAQRGTLAIFCGGAEDDVERARPALLAYGGNLTRLGPIGAGQTGKLCNQILVGSAMCALAEAVRLADAAGLDAALLPGALAGGAADSTLLRLLLPRMLSRPTDSMGAARTMKKDLDAALDVARATRTPLPLTAAAAALFQALEEAGLGDEDPSRLVDLHGRRA